MGYHRAGFDVIGVDLHPQPNYPFPFIQGDALNPPVDLNRVDVIHASPPCQDHSILHSSYGAAEHGTGWMLPASIEMLDSWGGPYVVENVATATMPSPIELCGATFGLGASGLDLNRHRRFQLGGGVAMLAPTCQHRRGKTIGVYGNGTNSWHRAKLGRNLRVAEMREAMGIDWMTRRELSQAIPPAYTEHIGRQLLNEPYA